MVPSSGISNPVIIVVVITLANINKKSQSYTIWPWDLTFVEMISVAACRSCSLLAEIRHLEAYFFNQALYSFSELGENTINHKSQGQMVWLWDFFLIFAKIYY